MQIFYIFEDDEGRIWVSGEGTLGYYDGTSWRDLVPEYRRTSVHEPDYCWEIAQDGNGHLWFGGYTLVRYDGVRFHPYGKEDGLLDEGLPYGVARDAEGALWVGRENRIWRYDGHTFQPVSVEFEGSVRKIQQDREERMWFCTEGGALCYDGAAFHHFTTRDGLAYDSVNGMLQDREGQFWFATWGGGVSYYDPHSIHTPGEEEGLPYSQMSTLMESRKGKIWMGFSGFLPLGSKPRSVGIYDDGDFAPLDIGQEQELDLGDCVALCEDRFGHLWVGSFNGLYCYDGHSLRKVYPEEECKEWSFTSAIVEDDDGPLFFGQKSPDFKPCIIRYDGKDFQTVYQEESSSRFGYITAIVPTHHGALWFARGVLGTQGPGRGIGRLNEKGDVTFWTVEDGLADNRAQDLLEDQEGILWIATLGGISRFDGRQFQNFTIADGLPNNHVRCLYQDRRGRLWFGTDGGAVVYDGQVFQTVRTERVAPITRIIEDREGWLWFATQRGAVRYAPADTPPRVRVTQAIADQVFREPAEVKVSTGNRQVIFEYKGMSFRTPPRDMLYACRLQGHEEEWRPATRSMRALFQDLPPGEYTFQVKAIDRDLNYSEPATVRVTVEPDPHLEGLTEALRAGSNPGEFVGESAPLRRVLAQLQEVAPTDATVLILGETGTGKGLATRTLHSLSRRKNGPLITVSCGSLPEGLVESELFGHEQGAFTGALRRKLGKVELAAGGTLFLDEIGDLPLDAQTKLLRLLEEGTFERVSGTEELRSEARLVAATNRDLEQMVSQETFREDLFYRLHVVPVILPPLRTRREDLPLLAAYFLQRSATHLDKPVRQLSPDALSRLDAYAWPGNVRELEHVIQRAVIVCRTEILQAEDIALQADRPEAEPVSRRLTPEEYERQYLQDALAQTEGMIRGPHGAAVLLGMPESSLRFRMKKLGIQRS